MVHHRAKIIFGLKIAAVLCALVILIVSLLPNNGNLPAPSLNDKINHIIGYGVLTGLGVLAWRGRTRLLFVAIVTAQSGIVEILQANMSLGRNGDLYDMIANLIGITLGVVIGHGVVLIVRNLLRQAQQRA